MDISTVLTIISIVQGFLSLASPEDDYVIYDLTTNKMIFSGKTAQNFARNHAHQLTDAGLQFDVSDNEILFHVKGSSETRVGDYKLRLNENTSHSLPENQYDRKNTPRPIRIDRESFSRHQLPLPPRRRDFAFQPEYPVGDTRIENFQKIPEDFQKTLDKIKELHTLENLKSIEEEKIRREERETRREEKKKRKEEENRKIQEAEQRKKDEKEYKRLMSKRVKDWTKEETRFFIRYKGDASLRP